MVYIILASIPFTIAYVMLIWLDTEVFMEYLELFRIADKLSISKNFVIERDNGSPYNYKEYLLRERNNFFTRLISCPVCLSVWLSGTATLISAWFINPWLGLILWFPIAYLSLYLYEKIKKLLS
jgi:hypothetical protein